MDLKRTRRQLSTETRSLVISFGVAFFPELVAYFKKVYADQLEEDAIIDTIDRTLRRMEKEQTAATDGRD